MKDFAVIPYKRYLKMQEALEDYSALTAPGREARSEEPGRSAFEQVARKLRLL